MFVGKDLVGGLGRGYTTVEVVVAVTSVEMAGSTWEKMDTKHCL